MATDAKHLPSWTVVRLWDGLELTKSADPRDPWPWEAGGGVAYSNEAVDRFLADDAEVVSEGGDRG